MSHHILKAEANDFAAMAAGRKTAEIRLNDRRFKEGDTVDLREFRNGLTGRSLDLQITHVQEGLPRDLVFISYGKPPAMCEQRRQILLFLLGEAEFDGAWFGDRPPGSPHLWWRRALRELFADEVRLHE